MHKFTYPTFQNRNQNTWKEPGFKNLFYFVDIYFGYLFYHSLNQRKYYQANYINKPFSKKAGLIFSPFQDSLMNKKLKRTALI